ncbi:UNVERIFIED_CONTAM: hypothetical protein FKN15_055059 [Acipenser sinensis]
MAELYAALGLARQQAQALSVALAQPITLAPELTPPALVVAPDVMRWHLPYSPGCLAGLVKWRSREDEPSVQSALAMVCD